MNKLQWFASKRFLSAFDHASQPLQDLARREILGLQQRAVSTKDWLQKYRKVEHLKTNKVRELEVGSGPRILFHVDSHQTVLLEFGTHEVTANYSDQKLAKDLQRPRPLDVNFTADNPVLPMLGGSSPKKIQLKWHTEIAPEWLYFLDDRQREVYRGIVEAAERKLLYQGRKVEVQFIVGGPGTGKTSLLLQILMGLSRQVTHNKECWRVGFDISDPLADYITASLRWDLTESRRLARTALVFKQDGSVQWALDEGDVLLLDDPASAEQITDALAEARNGSVRVIVAAFDPLQMFESLTDEGYQALKRKCKATEWVLESCYRQKEEVGRLAKGAMDAVARSTPFLREDKKEKFAAERRRLTALANQTIFVNPSGYSNTFAPATVADWQGHLRWIRQQELWRHWNPLLVVSDERVEMPAAWHKDLGQIRHTNLQLGGVQEIKGLEYQHVILLLHPNTYRDITKSFTGSGQAGWNRYRLMRIPFTRAKDSLVVFVMPSEA